MRRKEAPDPQPKRRGPMVMVEDGVRLSDSRLWRLQRAFFVAQDPLAWGHGRVPSYVTSNAFAARAVARVVAAFVEDCAAGRLGAIDPREPIHVIELGAGSGRFAFNLLRELEARSADAAWGGLRVRVVVTDLHEAPVAALRANPRLARFVASGLLDFAVLDAEAPDAFRLRGENPVVAIGNYVLDGIPADAFEVHEGALHESLLHLECPKGVDADDPAALGRFLTSFSRGAATRAPYGDAELDSLVASLAARMTDGHFLFPVAALRLAGRLRALGSGRLLLLAADRGHVHEAALVALEPPLIARHGSVSLDVNFHALAQHAVATGGAALLPAHHPTHLATCAFLWGCADAAHSRTRDAYVAHLGAGGPEDLFLVKTAIDSAGALDAERALAWLRLSAWDAEVFVACAPALMAALDDAPPTVRLDVLDAAMRVRDARYPVGGDADVEAVLGDLLLALDALPEAERALAESVDLHGATAEKLHRLALCASGQHRLPDALARLDEALALDASYEPARAMGVALRAQMRARRSR